MPRISVIIPVHNRAGLVRDCIESVRAQTYQDFEIIVVDDGSTDGTRAVLQTYGECIRFIAQENRGQGGSYARNAGVQAAQGEFIAFLDSDDLWLPEKLARQIALFEANPDLMWAYTDMELFDGQSGEVLYRLGATHPLFEGDILEPLFVRTFVPLVTLMVRREVFAEVGDFWPTAKGTDTDMMLRIAAKYPIAVVPQVLTRYRVHANSVTGAFDNMRAYELSNLVRERAVQRDPQRLMPLYDKARAQAATSTALLLARQGHVREARALFREAIRLAPGELSRYPYWLGTFLGTGAVAKLGRLRRTVRSRFHR